MGPPLTPAYEVREWCHEHKRGRAHSTTCIRVSSRAAWALARISRAATAIQLEPLAPSLESKGGNMSAEGGPSVPTSGAERGGILALCQARQAASEIDPCRAGNTPNLRGKKREWCRGHQSVPTAPLEGGNAGNGSSCASDPARWFWRPLSHQPRCQHELTSPPATLQSMSVRRFPPYFLSIRSR